MIRRIRERINLALYDSKENALKILAVVHLMVSLSAVGILVFYYGFPHPPEREHFLFQLIQASFGFYIFRYLLKLFYDFHPLRMIRKTWIEATVLGLLFIEGAAYNLFNTLFFDRIFESFGWENFQDTSIILIQLFFFSYLLYDVYKTSRFRPWARLHPALIFLLSIAGLIIIGTGFLMLPEMSNINGGMPLVDALFLSSSTVSCTGLATVDVPTMLTLKGQIVLLILMKVGGLNTIAFGALLFIFARFGLGVRQHEVIEDFVNKQSMQNAGNIFRKTIIWATTIEIIGIIALFFLFEPEGIFSDVKNRLWHATFHGVSAFNNAGLSIIPGGFENPIVSGNYLSHIVMTILIFLGGFGMLYVFDLFEINRLRERMRKPWKGLEFGTKVSLYFTLALLIFGTVVFMFFEYNGVIAGQSTHGKVITSIFHSMTTRNAGFSSISISELSLPVLIIFLFLMFVGASSGSAGGGIRTSTFAVMWASVISTIRGRERTELFKRTIDNSLVLKAYSVTMFFIFGNLVGIFALAFTEATSIEAGNFTLIDLAFEHVSAASTVGLSTGITSNLSEAGKVVITLAMFIGRVGTLTIAYLFIKSSISKKYKYPLGHTMIG